VNREDHWGNRQVGPHAHCAHFWHKWVFIPDLGENAVFQYRYDPDAKTLTRETYIPFEPAPARATWRCTRPWTSATSPTSCSNTVCVAQLDAGNPDTVKARLIPVQYQSTLDSCAGVSYVSEIKLSPDARFLYVSNRGDNSVAIFKVLSDVRSSARGWSRRGKFPRHFAITPDGKAVIVATRIRGTSGSSHGMWKRAPGDDRGSRRDPGTNYIRFVNV